MQTSLMEKESDSHKLYLSKTVENRIDDFRRFFYTDDNGSVLTDASTPFGLEPSLNAENVKGYVLNIWKSATCSQRWRQHLIIRKKV